MPLKKEGEHTTLLFDPVQVKPIDGPVGGQMSQAWQQNVMALAPKMCLGELVGFLPDIADSGFAVIHRRFHTFAKAEVAFEQVIEDQIEITLGFRREFNSELHGPGAYLRLFA